MAEGGLAFGIERRIGIAGAGKADHKQTVQLCRLETRDGVMEIVPDDGPVEAYNFMAPIEAGKMVIVQWCNDPETGRSIWIVTTAET